MVWNLVLRTEFVLGADKSDYLSSFSHQHQLNIRHKGICWYKTKESIHIQLFVDIPSRTIFTTHTFTTSHTPTPAKPWLTNGTGPHTALLPMSTRAGKLLSLYEYWSLFLLPCNWLTCINLFSQMIEINFIKIGTKRFQNLVDLFITPLTICCKQ